MRTMVTGGAGFVGSTLVDRLLAEGHQVDVVDDLSAGSLSNLSDARAVGGRALTIHQIDITLPEVVALIVRRKPEIVFHLAAQVDADVAVERPAFDASVNVVGSINVLEGARGAGTERIVYAASGGTLYGEADASELPIREAHAQCPQDPAGVSKKVVLDFLSAYRERYALEFVALALANVYGPRQLPAASSGVVSVFARQLVAGEPVTIHGGRQTRDFVYVDDVADAFVRAGSRGGGLLCNVGTGHEVSIDELYRVMAAEAGVTVEALHAPGRPDEISRSCLSPDRAAMQLGWRSWTPLREGVRVVLEEATQRLRRLQRRDEPGGND